MGTDVVDDEDVGMVERGQSSRFLLEPTQTVGIGGVRGGQHLDRDLAAEPGIAGAIDLPHAAGTEGCQNLVRAETGAWGERHRFSLIREARGQYVKRAV